MKIMLSLSQKGVQEALKQVQAYKTLLDKKCDEMVRKLADKGLEEATVRFAHAEYAGSNDMTCRVEHDKRRATIYAEGQAVAFIEFGTGVAYTEHPSGMYKHGTYGKGKGASQNGWAYKGQKGTSGTPIPGRDDVYRTRGNPPAEAMWEATALMARSIEEVWREVMT